MAHPNPSVARHNEITASAALERTSLVVSLRGRRMTFAAIAGELQISETTARSLYKREKERLRTLNASKVEEQLDEVLDALDVVEREAHAIAADDKTSAGVRLKALNVVINAEDKRAKILGLYAPEQHRHLHGHVDPGIDLTLEELESMGDDELAAHIEEQRTIRAVKRDEEDAEHDASTASDDEPDEPDGLPPEVVIEDPGPRALAPAPPDEESDGIE